MKSIASSGKSRKRGTLLPDEVRNSTGYCFWCVPARSSNECTGLTMPGKTYCCVVNCHNFSGKVVDGRSVTLHRFPCEKKVKNIWLSRVSRKDFKVKSWSRVCSEHFIGKNGPSPEVNLPSIFPHKVFKISKLQDQDIVLSGHNQPEDVSSDVEADVETESLYLESASRLDVSVHMHDYGGQVNTSTLTTFRHQEVYAAPSTADADSQTDLRLPSYVSTGTQTEDIHDINSDRPWLTVDDLTDAEMMFYTGLKDKDTYNVLFEDLTEDESSGRRGRPHKLSLKDEFFMVLMRLRLGLLVLDLARRFRVSSSTISSVFNCWIDKMYNKLSFLIYWPTQEAVRHNMPESFRSRYPTTRVIIDCTEVYTETPKSLINKTLMYSDYKSHMTWKVLVGISPSGVITYVSSLWGGNISDKQITEMSGFLKGLDCGDAVMADKGFQIADLLIPRNVQLIIPPRKQKNCKFTAREVESTRRIANLRIHVERAMERIKNFRILQGVIPLSMSDQVSKILYICAALCNLQSPLIQH